VALEHRNLKNNWSTTLQADAAAADTTLSLLQAWIDKLTSPNPSATEWYMLTLDDGVQAPEIVRCTAKGTGTATVVRSQEGTVAPSTWAALISAAASTAFRCWGFMPGCGRRARIWISRMAWPVITDRARALRRIWPPPSPNEALISIIAADEKKPPVQYGHIHASASGRSTPCSWA
jgi:hypothetical protein